MDSLPRTLEALRERIARYRGSRKLNEENTKATLIEPVLAALGWNLEDLDEVHREWKFQNRDKPVDYALRPKGTPRLLIEAKALGEDLGDRRWASQAMTYATVAGVEWVVLTNGDEYRLYNALAAVSVDEKLFRSVRVSDPSTRPGETLELLAAETLREDRLKAIWDSWFVDRKVESALSRLFASTPDPEVIRLVRKRAQKLSLKEIRASLSRVTARFEFDARERSAAATARPSRRVDRSLATPRNVSLADLIATRLITPPLPLFRRTNGTEVTARVEANGTVTFAGKTYSSLSTAAGVARASTGTKSPGRTYPQTNGWSFWQFRDDDGELREIDVLRQRFLGLRKLRRVGGLPASSSGDDPMAKRSS